jgi:1,4-dihydroxy-2-naphthoyl-CoA hydrolase
MPDLPEFPADREELIESLVTRGMDKLPGVLDLEVVEIGDGSAIMRCLISEKHLALNGYLHAAAVVALADTTAGYGCIGNLPDGGIGFTTMELKSNHIGTVLEGTMIANGTMAHGGRTTQVWDVTVSDEATGKPLALFRCTQMILYSRS